jgi:SAM-dependent methyltransferase
MAHPAQMDFCRSVKQKFPNFFSESLVLDVGSLDINGNNQYLFENCLYLGVDLQPGRNVDLVCSGHELSLPDQSIDVVVSTECFEHDQFYAATLRNIARMLRPGGLFLFTCATTGRAEHGTRRTTPQDAPLLQGLGAWGDYYKNLDEKDVRQAVSLDDVFQAYEFSFNRTAADLYFWGIKKGYFSKRHDYSFLIAQSDVRSDRREQEAFIVALLERLRPSDCPGFDLKQIGTCHGTRLFLVPESSELRHGPHAAPWPAVLLAQHGQRAYFLHLSDSGTRVLRVDPSGPRGSVGNDLGEDAAFAIVPGHGKSFGLRRRGLLLCAEGDGRVTLSRHRLDRWESFIALDAGRA